MARRARPVVLSTVQRGELEKLWRAVKGPAALSRRAHAVLLMSEGIAGAEIARRIGYTPVQVSRLRQRFLEDGVGGLRDRPRSGRPREIDGKRLAQVIGRTLRRPPRGLTHWTAREMASELGLSHTTVLRVWREHNLKPHRFGTFKFTKDPDAEDKIRDIVGLYLSPPSKAAVVCIDEKTQIQALSRTQPLLPVRPGLPARRTHDYQRNGLTCLFAALDVARGKVLGQCRPRHRSADFLAFLKKVARSYRGELHVVLDNASTHKTPDVQAWLERNPRVHFHFTPTGASWLNLIEVWFSTLTTKSIRRGSFDTVRQLVRHIESYIEHWNKDCSPFVWTKSPDDIVRKAIRAN